MLGMDLVETRPLAVPQETRALAARQELPAAPAVRAVRHRVAPAVSRGQPEMAVPVEQAPAGQAPVELAPVELAPAEQVAPKLLKSVRARRRHATSSAIRNAR